MNDNEYVVDWIGFEPNDDKDDKEVESYYF
jgi:hypothetical protein